MSLAIDETLELLLPPPKPAGATRVLHTADWHLGKMLGDRSRLQEQELFLRWLLKTLRALEVDVLLVCGDIFDTANPPQEAERIYYEFLATVHQECRDCRCSIVVTGGNHDSPAHLAAPAVLLQAVSVRVISHFPEDPARAVLVLPCEETPCVVVAAVPFLRDRDLRTGHFGQSSDEIRQDLHAGIRRRYEEVAAIAGEWKQRGLPVIATGHLTVQGARTSESEREIHIGGLGAVGPELFPQTFDYVALGHLHGPQQIGRSETRYSGSPIPLSFSEAADVKEVRLLEFQAGALVRNEALAVPLPRPLVRLRADAGELQKMLAEFAPPPSELRPWVELTVSGATGADLLEQVRLLAKDAPYDILQVRAASTDVVPVLDAGDNLAADEENLLNDPREVFRRRLDQEQTLPEEEREQLTVAFNELIGLHAERAAGENKPVPAEVLS